ncbi:hypothetical protein HDV64DRAFT_243021 [Trichoderma sp. TUCIM 5745]
MRSSHIPPLPLHCNLHLASKGYVISPPAAVASSFDWETWMSLRCQGIAQCPHPAAKMRCDQPST